MTGVENHLEMLDRYFEAVEYSLYSNLILPSNIMGVPLVLKDSLVTHEGYVLLFIDFGEIPITPDYDGITRIIREESR
jgi:hypothetical protein